MITIKTTILPIFMGATMLLCGFLEPKHSKLADPKVVVGKDSKLSVTFKIIPNAGMKLADSQGAAKAPWELTIEPAESFGLKPNKKATKYQTKAFNKEIGGFQLQGTDLPKGKKVKYRLKAFVCTKVVDENSQCYPEIYKGTLSW